MTEYVGGERLYVYLYVMSSWKVTIGNQTCPVLLHLVKTADSNPNVAGQPSEVVHDRLDDLDE